MNPKPDLPRQLQDLYQQLRQETYARYRRINPPYEDLLDWKERGAFWTGRVNADVTIYNSTTVVGDVEIGDHSWVGPFCSLDGTGGLRIGRHCSLSVGTQISTHDTVKWCLSGGEHPYEYAAVRIGDRCFIGSHAVILKGVTIGDECVVGAGAVVTADVPSNTIVGGVPARRIGITRRDAAGRPELVIDAGTASDRSGHLGAGQQSNPING